MLEEYSRGIRITIFLSFDQKIINFLSIFFCVSSSYKTNTNFDRERLVNKKDLVLVLAINAKSFFLLAAKKKLTGFTSTNTENTCKLLVLLVMLQ